MRKLKPRFLTVLLSATTVRWYDAVHHSSCVCMLWHTSF